MLYSCVCFLHHFTLLLQAPGSDAFDSSGDACDMDTVTEHHRVAVQNHSYVPGYEGWAAVNGSEEEAHANPASKVRNLGLQ